MRATVPSYVTTYGRHSHAQQALYDIRHTVSNKTSLCVSVSGHTRHNRHSTSDYTLLHMPAPVLLPLLLLLLTFLNASIIGLS